MIIKTNGNKSIKALVFDFDGLILNTEEPEFHSWRTVYQEYGASLDLEEWLACVGASLAEFDPIQNLLARVNSPIDIDQILQKRKRLFDQRMREMEILPGVKEYLSDAKKMGLGLAIASSSSSDWVVPFLEKLNIRDVFDAICVSDHVDRVKPDPALYRCAVQRLAVEPAEAVAFEDSYNGLLAAKNAGLYCVAVPNNITRNLDFSRADHILNSLAEIPLSDLLTKLEG